MTYKTPYDPIRPFMTLESWVKSQLKPGRKKDKKLQNYGKMQKQDFDRQM